MFVPPDRLGHLSNRIEAGEPIMNEDLKRLALLQALDLARVGEACRQESEERESAADDALEAAVRGA